MAAPHLALLQMAPWTGISCCVEVAVARLPHSPEPTLAVAVAAFLMSLNPAMAPIMAAYPEAWACGRHVLDPWALALWTAASPCPAAVRPSPQDLSLGPHNRLEAAPCPNASRQSPTAWRMTRAAWPMMMRAVPSWTPTTAQPLGGGLSAGVGCVPGEHPDPIPSTLTTSNHCHLLQEVCILLPQ